MKHTFEFKDDSSLGWALYDTANKFERGFDCTKKEGYFVMYIKCTKKDLDIIIKKALLSTSKFLKKKINEKKKEISVLSAELESSTLRQVSINNIN